MKTVIRRGVFETNSSSTHTLTIVKEGEAPSVEMEEVSFEICSPVAKVFMIFGLIENSCGSRQGGWQRELMLRFKEAAVTALAEIEGVSRDEALSLVECEAFGNTSLKRALGDEARLRELLKSDERFAAEFKAAGKGDITAFAETYFKEDLEVTRKLMRGRYRCDAYFYHGCLIECDCGFESFRKMARGFGLDRYDTDEMLLDRARRFLSGEYTMLAEELNAGIIPMTTGEKY